MQRTSSIIGCILALSGPALVAGEALRGGGVEDLTVPILKVSEGAAAMTAMETGRGGPIPMMADLARGAPLPQMTFELPFAPPGSGFSSGGRGDVHATSPGMERRLERLREDWAAVDAQRLLDERRQEGTWNRVVGPVFAEPRTLRIGHTELGGGLIDAIQRRNPFCLLTPVLFSFSF